MNTSLIAALALFAASTPALAMTGGEPVSIDVRADDLDLTTAAGQKVLSQRVTRAARHLCTFQARSLAEKEAEKSCVALAMKYAAPQVELAVARSGKPVRLATSALSPRG